MKPDFKLTLSHSRTKSNSAIDTPFSRDHESIKAYEYICRRFFWNCCVSQFLSGDDIFLPSNFFPGDRTACIPGRNGAPQELRIFLPIQ